MASGRPRRPNDPSIMASVEAAVSTVSRPGLLGRLWHWRYELALLGLRQGGSVNSGPMHGSLHQPVSRGEDAPGIKSVFVPRIHEKWQHGQYDAHVA